MNENLLQFIWKNSLYNKENLRDTAQNLIVVHHPGYLNTNAGPDFINAKITIGETLWAGNVEIHLNGKEWFTHNHHLDAAYNNVILHVCLTDAETAIAQDNNKVLALNLEGRIDKLLLQKYEYMMAAHQNIPCQNLWNDTKILDWVQNQDNLLVERLQHRVETINEELHKNNGNWDELLYQYMAAALGQKVNNQPMKMLSASLPYTLIQKHIEKPLQIEALLFGNAGLLSPHFKDNYPQMLLKEYQFLTRKYNLESLETAIWKFMRLRPAAFPTIRIAQLASLVNTKRGVFMYFLEEENLEKVISKLQSSPAEYWQNHYTFDTQVNNKSAILGVSTVHSVVINALIPVLFAFGKTRGNQLHCDKALHWLEQLPAENNKTTRKFKHQSILIESAQHSQAILQLYNNYCTFKRCLSCGIGNKLLTK